MKCTLCQKDNESGSWFCAFCGAPLQTMERLNTAYRETQRLSQAVTSISERLAALERRQEMQSAAPESVAGPQAGVSETANPSISDRLAALERRREMESAPSGASISDDLAKPDVEVWVAPGGDEVPALVRAEAPAGAGPPGGPPPPPAKPRPAKPQEWEQILGGNWLARVGVITLIVGVAFFLKFAFDNNWLGPLARVILGVISGLALLTGGYFWRRKYPVFAQAISGGGIGILYLSVFAAFVTFGLIGAVPSVALMLVVSIGSAAIAVKYNSMALAILGILGAFVAPVLLGAAIPGGDRGAAARLGLQLLVYVLVVDVGVLVLSTFRNWRWFTFLALGGSLVFFVEWYALAGNELSLLASEGGLTFIFLVFVGATTLHHLLRRLPARGPDYALMVINAAAYLGISYGLMWSDLREWMGGFSLLLAVFYSGLAYGCFRRSRENTTLGFFGLGIAIVFLAIAIPIQLGDRAWTTVAWAAQAAVLVWLSSRVKVPHFRVYAYCAFCLVAVRLMFFDSWLPALAYVPVFNERLVAFLAGVVAMYFAGYLTRRDRVEGWQVTHAAFVVAGNVMTLWLIGVEVAQFPGRGVTTGDSLRMLVVFALAAALIMREVIWRPESTTLSMVLTSVNAVVLGCYSIFLWGDLRAWMGGLYLALSACNAGLAYSLLKSKTTTITPGLLAAGISVAFLTMAVPVQFGNQVWTTIAWAAELVILMWLSFRIKMPQLRYYSYGALVLMAGHLLVFRTAVEAGRQTPVLNERFLVYLIGIAASYIAAYFLSRNRGLYSEWKIPASTFLVCANFLTLWLLSFEVWDYFESRQAAQLAVGGTSAQQLALTALWAMYAVVLLVVGIAKRSRPVRVAGLGLLVLPIIKLFVYDVFALEQVYRIIAFVGLGVLLIASAYLYQRYSKAIKGFILSR